jgi:cytochrome P450
MPWDTSRRAQGCAPRARSRDLHRSLQSAWQPTLSSESLAGYAPAMNAAAGRLAERLGAVAAAGGELDMLTAFFRVAVDVVGAAVFGRATQLLAAYQPLVEVVDLCCTLYSCKHRALVHTRGVASPPCSHCDPARLQTGRRRSVARARLADTLWSLSGSLGPLLMV